MKTIKTIYVNVYVKGAKVHTAAIRSDWKESDFEELTRVFKGGYIRTTSRIIPLYRLGYSYNNSEFKNIAKWKLQ